MSEYICSGCGIGMKDFYAVSIDENGHCYICPDCMNKKTMEYYQERHIDL